MPGIFSKSARPPRPGAYFDWSSIPTATVQPNIGSIVLLPIVHDWGPAGTATPTVSLADFQAKFGPTNTTPGYKAVLQAFEGENVYGRGGAGTVIAYRMVNASGVAASKIVQNTTPATAITLTAKYLGSYGNNLGWRNTANAINPATNNDFAIMLGSQVLETYTYAKTDMNALVALINASSQWVTATMQLSGVALPTALTVTALTGGNDGSTLVALDWTNMMTACGPLRFSLFAPYDLVDPTILASIQAWAVNANAVGRRFMTVCGGALNETAATAATRSGTLQATVALPNGGALAGPENFVNLGVGSVVDNVLGTLSTSQLAPRIAGILASRGETMSLTFARLAGVTPGVMPTDSDILTAFSGGVTVLGMDSNPDAPIRVEKGLTTYITATDPTKPYLIYRNPKFVRTMHGIELEITDWATTNAIGLLEVNDSTRAYVVGHAHEVIDARALVGSIQQGFTVGIDPAPPPSDNDEFIGLVYGIAFGRSVEQIFNLVYIS